MLKPLTMWITVNWKILKEIGLLDHFACLLRNLYAGQEATVRTGHGTINWFQIGKGVHQGCLLSPCLFNFYAEWKVKVSQLCLTLCDPRDYSPWSHRVRHDWATELNWTSCEMLGWMNHKLESRLLGKKINNLRYVDDTTLMAESKEELKSRLMRVKEETEKAGLKFNIQKMKIMASSPITS